MRKDQPCPRKSTNCCRRQRKSRSKPLSARRPPRPRHSCRPDRRDFAGSRPANEFAGRGADREAHAHARHREGILLAAEDKYALPATNADDEFALGEDDADGAVSARHGVARPALAKNPSTMASIIPVRYFFITLPSPVRAPGHRGVGLRLRAGLLREQHREVAEYGEQDARNGVADRESDPGHRTLGFSRRLARRAGVRPGPGDTTHQDRGIDLEGMIADRPDDERRCRAGDEALERYRASWPPLSRRRPTSVTNICRSG